MTEKSREPLVLLHNGHELPATASVPATSTVAGGPGSGAQDLFHYLRVTHAQNQSDSQARFGVR